MKNRKTCNRRRHNGRAFREINWTAKIRATPQQFVRFTTMKSNFTVGRKYKPLYSKKGIGGVKNPKRAAYSKVYHKITFSAWDWIFQKLIFIVCLRDAHSLSLHIYSFSPFVRTQKGSFQPRQTPPPKCPLHASFIATACYTT